LTKLLLNDFAFYEKRSYGLSGLSTVSKPLGSLLCVDFDFNGISEGIVVTDFFDELTVTGRSLVCYNYAVEGSLLCAKSLKSDFNCRFLVLQNVLLILFFIYYFH